MVKSTNIFVKVHRSYCVNVNYIVALPRGHSFKMSNGDEVKISKTSMTNLGDKLLLRQP